MNCLVSAFRRLNNRLLDLSLVAVIAAGFAIVSCKQGSEGISSAGRSGNIKATLADIKSYIDEHPDSALKAINAIDTNDVRGRRVKAKYALLKCRALDKNNIDTTDVRLIAPAVEYYNRHGTAEDRAKAYYCEGRIKQNAKDYNSAIVSFTKAEENAENAGNYYVKGLIQRCIADIYNHTYQQEDELRYHRMAYENFKKAGKLSHSRYELLNIANALQNQRKFTDSEKLYREILGIARKNADTTLMTEVLYAYSALCVNKDTPDPQKAISLLEALRDTLGFQLDAGNLGDLACAYALLGDNDKAQVSLKEAGALAVDPAAKAAFLDASYSVAKCSGDYRSALGYLESAVKIQNSLLNVMLNQSVNVTQKEYFKQRASSADAARLGEKKIAILSINLLILLLAIVAYLAYKTITRRNKSIEEYQNNVRDALLEKEALGHELEARKMGVSKEFKAKFEIIGKLVRHHYGYSNDASARMRFEDEEVKGLISEMTGKVITGKLQTELDDAMDGIMTKLREEFPRFKEEDYLLMTYWFSGFPTEVISLLMGVDKDWVYKRKSRLKERILLSSVPDKELFLKNMVNLPI